MVISVLEVSNRREQLLKSKALKKLKELRKETRSAMQRYEGDPDVTEDERSTYDDLNLSLVVLNGLNDHLMRVDALPESWDKFTFGSEFDKDAAPLLRWNDEGDLWVEFFECEKPEDLMRHVAGNAVAVFKKKAPLAPQRPVQPTPTQQAPQASASDGNLMDLIRTRMPNRSQAQYTPGS